MIRQVKAEIAQTGARLAAMNEKAGTGDSRCRFLSALWAVVRIQKKLC